MKAAGLCPQSSMLAYALLILLCAACTSAAPEAEGESGGHEAQLKAETLIQDQARAALKGSWILAAAHQPEVLQKLEESDGWVSYFQGKLPAALAAFQRENTPQSSIGVARSALELAESYRHWRLLYEWLLPRWIEAEAARPESALTPRWRCLLRARLKESPLSKSCASLLSEGEIALWKGDLTTVAERASELPGARPRWRRRAQALLALRADPMSSELDRSFTKLDPQRSDLKVTDGGKSESLHDPALFRVWEEGYAAIALRAVSRSEVSPWGALLKAQALTLLGQSAQAEAALKTLMTLSPRPAPPIELYLLSESESPAALEFELFARAARLALMRGAKEEAARLLKPLREGPLAAQSSAQVWRSWARAPLKEPIAAPIFPDRRRHLLNATISLFEGAPMGEQVSSLQFPERWVDALQTRFAYAAFERDLRPLAMKNMTRAEDHQARLQLSGRNRLSRLLLTARLNLRMNRLRPAAKYLTRIREPFPASRPLARLIGDLLSFAAKERGGGVNFGQ